MSKPAIKSRTNQTVAALLTMAVGERIARRVGMEPSEVTDVLLGAVELALAALAVYFRQQANPKPQDRQGVISEKPRKSAKGTGASA